MFESCLAKQNEIRNIFNHLKTPAEKYEAIMNFGKNLKRLAPEDKTESSIVKGCQSLIYLKSTENNGKIFFEADGDALISIGLAALLITIYSGEEAETILKCPPTCLEDIGILASLTPSRANGLYNIHLKMKQEALKFLLDK